MESPPCEELSSKSEFANIFPQTHGIPDPPPETPMSWLYSILFILGGLVSTVSALAITAVIALVLGQLALLAYARLRPAKAESNR